MIKNQTPNPKPQRFISGIITLALALPLLLAPVVLPGCASRPNTNASAVTIQRINSLSYLAASIGAQQTMERLPDSRPKFALAYEHLNTLVESKTITGADLRALIASLPDTALSSGQARIYIDAATVLYDLTVGDRLNLESAPYVLAAATGIRDGLAVALKQ